MKTSINRNPDRAVNTFFIVLVTLFFSSIVSFILTDGHSFYSQFYYDKNDYFMDFFNPIKFAASDNPYQFKEMGAIYPPIAYVIFNTLGRYLPGIENLTAFEIRSTQFGMIEYIIFILVCLCSLFYLMNKHLCSNEYRKLFFLGALLFSAPMLYLIERGNILLLVVVLILFYTLYSDSKNAGLKEAAIICLALAASIKIYPAVLGLILISRRQYILAARCTLYGVIFFCFPFLLYGGLPAFFTFISNLQYGIADTFFKDISIYTRVDLATVLGLPYFLFKGDFAGIDFIAKIISIPLSVQFAVGSFVFSEKWKKVLCLTCVMLVFPPFSYAYCIVLYLIPIFLFLTEKHYSDTDVIFSFLFAILITSLPFMSIFLSRYVSLNVVFQNVTQLCLFAVLFLQVLKREIELVKTRLCNRSAYKHGSSEYTGQSF